jgi:hypothetical protein
MKNILASVKGRWFVTFHLWFFFLSLIYLFRAVNHALNRSLHGFDFAENSIKICTHNLTSLFRAPCVHCSTLKCLLVYGTGSLSSEYWPSWTFLHTTDQSNNATYICTRFWIKLSGPIFRVKLNLHVYKMVNAFKSSFLTDIAAANVCIMKKNRGLYHVSEGRYLNFSSGPFSEILAKLTAPAVHSYII